MGTFTTCYAARLQLFTGYLSRCYFVELCCSSPLHLPVRDTHCHAQHAEGGACMALQRDKVRDVQYNQSLGRVASLVTNGSVQLWDPHLRLAGMVRAF